jgi:hypothetical protein
MGDVGCSPKKDFKEMLKDDRIWFGEDGNNTPRVKKFLIMKSRKELHL